MILELPALAVPARPAARLLINFDFQKVISCVGQSCETISFKLDYIPEPAGGAKRRYSVD